MTELADRQKPATAARIYDYLLGGIHNFPADREAAKRMLAQVPDIAIAAQTNRGFVRRSVRYLVDAGVRQFLDLGAGIPTQGNVHEIAQQIDPEARVLYVDIDPVAVSESLEILDGNPYATAIQADVRNPRVVLDHPGTRELLDFDQPIAVILAAVLHFVPDDEQACTLVEEYVDAVVPGSYLVASHGTADGLPESSDRDDAVLSVYRQQTATVATPRTRAQVDRFFDGLHLVDPGVVRATQWRPDPGEADLRLCSNWAGVARK